MVNPPTCSYCGIPMVPNQTLVLGRTTLCCRNCRVFRLEGVDQFVPGGYGLTARLVATLPAAEPKGKPAYNAKTLPWDKLEFS
jgi:hypothetical protein